MGTEMHRPCNARRRSYRPIGRPISYQLPRPPAAGWPLLFLLLLLALFAAACGEETAAPAPSDQAPLLTLVQTATDAVELRIEGPTGLRALQARLTYDPARLKLTAVAAGKEAARLDRLFHADLTTSAGSVVVGLSDTRRVLLPARGALLELATARASGAAGSVTLGVSEALGAGEGAARVPLREASLEVKLP